MRFHQTTRGGQASTRLSARQNQLSFDSTHVRGSRLRALVSRCALCGRSSASTHAESASRTPRAYDRGTARELPPTWPWSSCRRASEEAPADEASAPDRSFAPAGPRQDVSQGGGRGLHERFHKRTGIVRCDCAARLVDLAPRSSAGRACELRRKQMRRSRKALRPPLNVSGDRGPSCATWTAVHAHELEATIALNSTLRAELTSEAKSRTSRPDREASSSAHSRDTRKTIRRSPRPPVSL